MQIERDGTGDFILEPTELAGKFGLAAEDFRQKIRLGMVTSTVERGEGEDAGTCRLSVRIGNRAWRAILDDHGQVLSEGVSIVRGPRRP